MSQPEWFITRCLYLFYQSSGTSTATKGQVLVLPTFGFLFSLMCPQRVEELQ